MGITKSNKKNYFRGAFGLITGGGDCPGLNAALRAVVKRSDREGIKVYGIYEGFKGLYEGHIEALRPIQVAGIINRGGTILGTSRFNPLKEKGAERILRKNLRRHRIACLINIG